MCLGRSESWKREQNRSADLTKPCWQFHLITLGSGSHHLALVILGELTANAADTQLRRDTYSRLTPVQRLQVARHPNRPTFLDIALNISDK